jgi:hypothetical protein
MSKKYQEYNSGRITIQYESRFSEIEEWNEFQREKKEIQDKYPSKPWEVHISSGRGNKKDPYEQEWWDEWQSYKKEITDLILEPNGNFSKFLYEIRSEREDVVARVWLRGKYNTEKYMKTRTRNDKEI